MKASEYKSFAALLSTIGEVYGKTLSPLLIDVYWHALRDCDFALIKKVIGLHVKSADVGQYFPKPADLLRWLEGSSEEKAHVAWRDVLSALKAHGRYGFSGFSDPLINRAIEQLGGWQRVCDEPQHSFYQLESRFIRYYIHAVTHAQRQQHVPALSKHPSTSQS